MRIVIALGGNALLQRHQTPTIEHLWENAQKAAQSIAPLLTEHEIILCHGNGPQVGLLALQAEAYKEVPAYPFDVLTAESQGLLGYVLQQALTQATPKSVVSVITRVQVSLEDEAWKHPAKPIGPLYTAEQVQSKLIDPGYEYQKDGEGFRRVIASPTPLNIIELPFIRQNIQADQVLICCGGGGIPVIQHSENHFQGVEAVIDKDLTAALLAQNIQADMLCILTDVDAVYQNWGTTEAQRLTQVTPTQLNQMSFAAGSMGPKIKAACQFVQNTQRTALIGSLTQAAELIAGRAGTRVIADENT